MKKRKRDKKTLKRQAARPAPPSKLEVDGNNLAVRGRVSDDQEAPKGLGRAVVTLNERLRRTPPREPLRDIDHLMRTEKKTGRTS